nr:hypothetical protein [Tanacetum cinerariifolium]
MVRLAVGQRRGRQAAAVVDRILWVSDVGDAVCGDGCSVDSSSGCHGGCGGVVLGCRGVGGGQRQLGMVVMLWCVEWWLAGGCGVEAVALVDRGVAVAAVAVGLWMVGRRMGASDIVDRVDRVIRILFGFAGKSPPKKFSDGGVVAGGSRWPALRGGRWSICVCFIIC